MKNKPNGQWFFIKAKDKSCQGYMPAKNKEEACKNFGLKPEGCSVKSVTWNGEEFVEIEQVEQGILLQRRVLRNGSGDVS